MNKKISFLVAIIIIIVCAFLVGGIAIWQYLEISKEEEKEEEIDKSIVLNKVKENIEKIKTVHAKEERKLYVKLGKESDLREEGIGNIDYDFIFPDKRKILATAGLNDNLVGFLPEEYGKDEIIIIGDDIYQKFAMFEHLKTRPDLNQFFEKTGLKSYQWIHGKEGESMVSFPAPDDKFYFSKEIYLDARESIKEGIEKIEKDLGVEEINGIKYHHYKVKFKKLSLIEDQIMKIDGISVAGLSGEETMNKLGGLEIEVEEPVEVKIPRVRSSFIQEGKTLRIFKGEEEILLSLPDSITAPVIAVKVEEERGEAKTPSYYVIETFSKGGEIWVGEDALLVYKEKIIQERDQIFFDPNEPEEKKVVEGVFDKEVSEIVYSDFNKNIEIKPPEQGVISASEFSKKWRMFLKDVYEKVSVEPPTDEERDVKIISKYGCTKVCRRTNL